MQGPTDYSANGVNNQTIEIPAGNDYAWAFFGCFLNVYDNTNDYGGQSPQHWLAGAAHSCLVAQIAYNDAPIINTGGVIENPENSDKLAQRNLQINQSGNPGFPVTHRVPQTIDVRPSPPPASSDPASIASYPDEMMIDWGNVPIGSVASIYWPAVSAASVLQLAAQLYPGHMLSADDPHTIQCKVVSQVSYVPIPSGTGGSFAGLFTVELPNGITAGETFDVVVRRITTKRVATVTTPPEPPIQRGTPAVADVAVPDVLLWRYVIGSFLVRINVQPESKILPNDENLVAVLKWRLGLIGPTNRWYPVLLRYIGYLSSRIDHSGGNAATIPPSPAGYQPSSPGGHGRPDRAREHCWTGKVVMELCYDRFGDFEGFSMRSETGEDHRFHAHERNIEDLVYRAWVERFVITVCVSARDRHDVVSVVLRRAPRPLAH